LLQPGRHEPLWIEIGNLVNPTAGFAAEMILALGPDHLNTLGLYLRCVTDGKKIGWYPYVSKKVVSPPRQDRADNSDIGNSKKVLTAKLVLNCGGIWEVSWE
jgi:hypothetical protein